MKKQSRIIKFGLPVIILTAGLIGMAGMVLSKAPPPKIEKKKIGMLVETKPLRIGHQQTS